MLDATTQKPTPAVLIKRKFVVDEMKWETAETFTLELKPAEGEEMLTFKAGQWVYLYLNHPDGTSWRAAFSVATAPGESKEVLQLGIKVYGDFTKKASHLMPGDVVELQGPFGVFTIHENVSPLVIFAGGIGVTPFRSMIRELALQKSPTQVILFYSNKDTEDIAYFDEFNHLADEWPAFKPIYLLTGHAPANWTDPNWMPEPLEGQLPMMSRKTWVGEIGRLSEDMVKRYIEDFNQGEFLMCGPPGFMEAVEKILMAQNVDTKKRLRKELFG